MDAFLAELRAVASAVRVVGTSKSFSTFESTHIHNELERQLAGTALVRHAPVDACNLMSAILLEANSPGGFDTAQPMLRLCFLALQQAINQHSQRAYVHDAEEDHLKQLWECVIVPCLRPVTDAVGGDRNSLAALAVATFVHVLRWADSSLEMLPSYIWESVGATVEHELGAGHQAVHWQQMCIALLALARGSDPAAVSFSLRICDAALSLVTSHERTRRLMASLQLMPALRSCAVAGVAAAAADGLHTAVLSLAAIPGETRQDAYSILCQFVSSTPAWYASPAFWLCVHDGLLDSDPLVRKRALFLLREALYAIGFGMASPVATQDQFADMFWCDLVAAQQASSQRLPLRWEIFISLLETLEDFPPHLVAEVWPHHECLFQSESFASSDAFCIPSIATPDAVPFWWSRVVLQRAFSNQTTSTKRSLLLQFLKLDNALADTGTPVGLQVSVEFLSDTLLAVLNDAQLYRYVTDEFPRSITSYYARVLQSIDELRKIELVQRMLAAISSNVFCFVELYSLLRAFHSFVPLGTAPFHALTPPSLTSFMLLISHIKADFMDMPRRLILPSAAALLVKCTQPDAVSVSVLCQSMTCFPQEALQLRAHGVQIVNILSAWLWQCEDGAWFTRVFTAALAGCVNRAEEVTDALDADSVALLMLLFVSRADAPMDETIALLASVLTGMYEEVYCPRAFRVRCLNLLTRCLEYAAVFPQLSCAMRAIVMAAETSLAAMLRASITPYVDTASAFEVSLTETTTQQLPLATCLKLLAAVFSVVPADTVPVLVALSSSCLEAALARLLATVGAPRDVSSALQASFAMHTVGTLAAHLAACIPPDTLPLTLHKLSNSMLARPRGAGDPALPLCRNPDLSSPATLPPASDDGDADVKWMIVLQEYQDHKWRAVAAVAAAYASTPPLEVAQTSVVADTCCAVLDEISDGLSIIVDKTLPFVLFSLKEVLRMYASTVDADVERVAAVLDLVFDALRQVKLHNEVIQGIASALLQEAIWAQPRFAGMVAPRVLAFAKRLDRPPQASLQLFTTHVCALVEVLAQSCREDSLAALHALMPLISWLAVYKETLSHGEEYLLCLPEERDGLMRLLSPEDAPALFRKPCLTAATKAILQLPESAAAVVRIQMLRCLDRMLPYHSDLKTASNLQSVVDGIVLNIHSELEQPSFIDTPEWIAYGFALRAWQAIAVFANRISESLIPTVARLLIKSLDRRIASGARHYMDCTLSCLLQRQPMSLIDSHMIPALSQFAVTKQCFTSLVLCAVSTIMRLMPAAATNAASDPDVAELRDCLLRLTRALLPWMISSYGSIRSMAQQAIMESKMAFDQVGDTAMSTLARGFEAFLADSEKTRHLHEQLTWELRRLSFEEGCKVHTILSQEPDVNGELIPVPISEKIIQLMVSLVTDVMNEYKPMFHVDADVPAVAPSSVLRARNVASVLNLQKKRTPWEDIAWGTDAMSLHVDGALTSTAIGASCHVPASILTYVDKKGRSCQPMAILASLLDKPANLGGLARTCEVFRAETLILDSLAVVGESLFRSLAVTAYEWACMEERHASELLACIREKKAQGYAVVGLEQSSQSIKLEHVILPEKILIVLGSEKRGIPVEVIQHLDICVEIPQFGVIRSLNVHVSASMLMWEYTRQRLLRRTSK